MATLRKDGRWQAKSKGVYGYGLTPELAEEDLARKLEADTLSTPRLVTLHEFAKLVWYPSLVNLTDLSRRHYEGVYINHIRPTFGDRPLQEINFELIQSWVRTLVSHKARKEGEKPEPLAPKTQAFVVDALKRILVMADELGYPIQRIPWRLLKMPALPPKRDRVLSVDEACKLLEAVEGTPLSAPVFFACVLGLRRGEAAGLKWSDLDRVKGELNVVRQRQGVTNKSVIEVSPKRGSARKLRLSPELIAEVDRRGDLDNEYICTYNGGPWVPDTITELWTEARVGLGLEEWTFHDLRHGAAGLIYAATKDLLAVAAVLGHKKPDMSLIYTALQEEAAGDGLKLHSVALFGRRPSTVTP